MGQITSNNIQQLSIAFILLMIFLWYSVVNDGGGTTLWACHQQELTVSPTSYGKLSMKYRVKLTKYRV
jgi:hypothetical protein